MTNQLNWEDYLPVALLIGANCAKDMPKKFCNHAFTASHYMANKEIVEASQEDKSFLRFDRKVHKWNSKHKCALCVNLKPSDSFHSSLTHRKYVTKCDDKNINTLNCSTSNCIYLKTCCRCGLQYVGETVQSLRDKFSGDRAGMKNPFADNRCKILTKHFSFGLCKNANYIVNIIEKLSGSGRDDNGNPIPGVTVERQKKETKWMLTLQILYPYGLNDRVGDEYMEEKDSRVVGNKFLPLHRL